MIVASADDVLEGFL
jgi:hypothetical protein